MNPYIVAGGVISVVLAYGVGHWQGDETGQAKIQQQWNQEKARLAEEYAKNLAEQREMERKTQATANKIREQKDREIREANARSAALFNSLRDRPERPKDGGMSQNAGTCSAATGAQLARGDGEFLARYSSDAARLQSEFNACVRQYQEIKKLLNKEDK